MYGKSHYYHLYLLIYDPTPFRFTYRSGVAQGMSRMMNLTYFVGLSGTNEQLIAIQVHSDQYLDNAQQFLDSLKSHGLVDESAHLLDVDAYVYESATFNQKLLHSWTTDATIEILQTGHIQNLSRYIPRWKEILKPWSKD
ncbi:MAG: hypothetical protein ACD_17C00082G0001 [uncultured bacterium]|nr:MAG: hypothetical protein ACD_17C00082G0001 [uncultured bacterium]